MDSDFTFYDYLINQGYLFDKETIENYLLSLKVKPFAILTGNSGTGKTKLSQLFAQYLSLEDIEYQEEEIESSDNPESDNVRPFTVIETLDKLAFALISASTSASLTFPGTHKVPLPDVPALNEYTDGSFSCQNGYA